MIAALGDRIVSIGADSADSSELRFHKRLLVGIALFILPIGFLWGCLYWVVGEEAVALTPWAYVAGSIISLAVFARNPASRSCGRRSSSSSSSRPRSGP